jgi:hypothetical protein
VGELSELPYFFPVIQRKSEQLKEPLMPGNHNSVLEDPISLPRRKAATFRRLVLMLQTLGE